MELRYFLAGTSLELDQGRCIGCGLCVEVCPHAVFSIVDRIASIDARDRCMECGACKRNCPAKAIKVQSGVGCAYAVLNGFLTGREPSCGCDDPDKPGKAKSGCC